MKALLLDRDGVLIAEREYVYTPEDMVLLPRVAEGLRRLGDSHRFFVVSNQSGVARGRTSLEEVKRCNDVLRSALKSEGVDVEDSVFCPHQPEDGCICRKPKTGMWDALKERHGLAADTTVMAGNRGSDVAFGRNIGCFTVLIEDAAHPLPADAPRPDARVRDLAELADHLLSSAARRVMTMDEAAAFAEGKRREGKHIVTTNGSFDLLHPGHLFLLREACKHGDVLVVGVNSDASVRRYKGSGRPVEAQAIRARKVAEYADAVFVFEEDDPRAWLLRIRPHVHANAATYGQECIEAPVLREIGAALVLVPVQPELGSTTELLRSRRL